MSSANSQEYRGRGEDEPLLGSPGDASQQDGQGIEANLILGITLLSQLADAVSDRCRHCHNCTSRNLDCQSLSSSRLSDIQADMFKLTATVWASVFLADLSLFSLHPVNPVHLLTLSQSLLTRFRSSLAL